MQATRRLLQHRQPMIRFLGKRHAPKQIDHSPHAHPASPSDHLPESFAQYRNRAIQHGPLGGQQSQQSMPSSAHAGASAGSEVTSPYGAIGGHSARELGSVQPPKGEFWDRNELPSRFHRARWTEAEIEAVESGGASLYG